MHDAGPPRPAATTPDLVFVGGCPRSGTTALTRLLNCHRDVLIGNERYYRVIERGELTPDHFESRRFLDVRETDTHDEELPRWPGASPDKLARARLVGDKYPPLFRSYDLLTERFPEARIVYILRNPFSVAESYQARAEDADDAWHFRAERGIADWNESLAATRAAIAAGLPITLVTYETVLSDRATVRALTAALGLDPDGFSPEAGEVLRRGATLAHAPTPRRERLRQAVALEADFVGYRKLTAEALGPARAARAA